MPSNPQDPVARLLMHVNSPDFARRALAAISAVSSASDPFDLLERLCRARMAFGVDGCVGVHELPEPEGCIRTLALLACDPTLFYGAWRGVDPDKHAWFVHARNRSTAMSGRTKNEAVDMASAMQPALNTYLVPIHAGARTGRFSALLLASAAPVDFDDAGFASLRSLAHALAFALHQWWVRHLRTELLRSARLRPTDMHLMRLEREGQVTKEISRALGMTGSAVDCRFHRISSKLGTSGRRAAAARAALFELL